MGFFMTAGQVCDYPGAAAPALLLFTHMNLWEIALTFADKHTGSPAAIH